AALTGALVLGLAAPAARAADKDAKIKVLIIDGQNNHDWRSTTPFMKKALEDSGRFAVDVATAPEKPQPPRKPKDPKNVQEAARYEEALAKYKEAAPVYAQKMKAFHPALDKYDVVLSNYNGDPWPKDVQDELEKYVKTGKGALVIVHAANNSFGGWGE